MILIAIASMPTSNEGTTEFPAYFAILKQNIKRVFVDHRQKISTEKSKQSLALFQLFETQTNRVLSIWAESFEAGLRQPRVSARFEFRFESLKSLSLDFLFVYKLMIGSSKNNRENYPRKWF